MKTYTPNDTTDIRKQVSYVSFLFKQKVAPITSLVKIIKKDSVLYNLHTDFSYLIHELVCGYTYRRHQSYTSIIDFINKIDVEQTVKSLQNIK